MKTFLSSIQEQLESAGYSFHKDVDNRWLMLENETVISSSIWLGELLSRVGKEFGLN